MPMYSFFCRSKQKHETERHASMHAIPKWVKCATCGKRALLGLSIPRSGYVKNAVLDRKTKEGLRWAFGKKKASKFRTTADVDEALMDVARRYPHLQPGYKRGRSYDLNSPRDLRELGTPSYKLEDPFKGVPISDDPRNHPEKSER